MKRHSDAIRTIDDYLAGLPDGPKQILSQLREAVRAAAPGAAEKISYQMPAYDLDGILVYFAAFKKHVGFYPTSSGISAFERELAPYAVSKGTVRFPFDKPLPLKLIARIVKYRVAENRKRARLKVSTSR
jgi:uncharacterized protein YdhG (YjbR/CyaY superfamily)